MISTHSDWRIEHRHFQRELNRRDGSYLQKSKAPFSYSPKALLEDVRMIYGVVAGKVLERMNRPHQRHRSF